MLNYECKVETKSPIRRALTISVKPESIKEYMDEQYANLQKTAKIKGFRAGKVPMTLIKQYYAQDVKENVFSKVVRESYTRALYDNKISAVGMPEIEAQSGAELKEGEPLTFVATIEVFPDIKITDLSKIKVERPSGEVTDEDIEKSIQNLRESHGEMVPNESYSGPAKAGDFMDITFKGTVDGESLESLQGENRLIELGAKHYMEEFENALIGMKKGENKDFAVSFPAEFSEPKLAGKNAQFNVTVHEFKKRELPNLDDEFAKRFKMETALELRKKMTESLKEDRERTAREGLKENLLRSLVEAHGFEVPTGLISSQVEYLMRENMQYLKQNGFTEKMIRDYLGKNQDEINRRAEEQVRASLILDKVAQENDVKVEDADLDSEFSKIASRVNIPAEQVRGLYEKDNNALRQLRFRIKEDRAIDLLLSQVKVFDAKKTA